MSAHAAVHGHDPALTASSPTPAVEAAQGGKLRVNSVDFARGLVMVIMLLDHTRDFVHADVFRGEDPVDMNTTYPALFFTRWITHFCAPVFVFLAGTSAWLQMSRGRSKRELSKFLVTRGLWLIVLEVTLVRFGAFWELNFAGLLAVLQVIWVLGVSMIVLAGLIHLPAKVVAAFGIAMIVLHNLLDAVRVQEWRGPGSPLPDFGDAVWMGLHQGGAVFPFGFPGPVLILFYPLVPWLGVMAVGYVFGTVYSRESRERRRWLMRWGLVITAGFVLLRALDVYGDPRGWSVMSSAAMTVVSFLNTEKYPPSLLFLMMTLGPAFLVLAYAERLNRAENPRGVMGALVTFGRVPLFFYLLQWPTAHATGLVFSAIAGKPTSIYFRPPGPGAPAPPDAGFDLSVVYVGWIVGVLLLYPLCRWFAALKARRRDWWLSYL